MIFPRRFSVMLLVDRIKKFMSTGARVFMAFELPNEELNKEAKKQAALDVLDRMNYMSEVK